MNLKPKSCATCKKTFKPSGPRSKWCSAKCKEGKTSEPSKPRRAIPTRNPGVAATKPAVAATRDIPPGEDRSFPNPFGNEAPNVEDSHEAEVISSGSEVSERRAEPREEIDPELREAFCGMLVSGCSIWNGLLTAQGIPAPPEEAIKPLCLLSTKCAERFGLFSIVDDDKWYLLAMTGISWGGLYGPPTVEAIRRVRAKRSPKPGPIPYTTAEQAPPTGAPLA